MKELRLPADVIKAIFHYMGAHKRFPADVPKLHKVFYDLSQEERFSELFRGFIFDTSKIPPYSVTVRCALDRFQKAKLLERINTGLNEFEVTDALSKWDLEKSKLFDEQEMTLLKEASRKFKEWIKG